MASVPVYSITRTEIDEFWRRKEVEAEERRLVAEKEAARIKAKTLKMEDCVLFEQMIREILNEGNKGDGTTMAPAATGGSGTEARIGGIKHWWTRSAYVYLNLPARPWMVMAEANTLPHMFSRRDVPCSAHQLHASQMSMFLPSF